MDDFWKKLECSLDDLHATLSQLGERWKAHANIFTIVLLVAGGIFLGWLYLAVIAPPDDFPLQQLVSVPENESLAQVAQLLQKDGVVRSALGLKLAMTLMGSARSVHAGDYLFSEPLDIISLSRALATGEYGLEPAHIRIPEGATVKQMAVIYSTFLSRFNAQNFLSEALPQEGYLFPDTYFFLPNATEQTVITTMRQNFDDKIATIEPQIASSTHSLSDVVKMASILEREAYNTQDRRMIAGVLWNRIARGMPLQVDSPFAYTLGKGTFQLTIADLTSDSPYNTYNHKGLPPTPIGSPSLDSLLAAVTPIQSDYLYFLADKNGVTHYCKTYSCQLANEKKYF